MAVRIDNCDSGPHSPGATITLTGTCDDYDLVTFGAAMNGTPVDYTTEPGDDGGTWTCVITMPSCPPGSTTNQTVTFTVREGQSSDICLMELICP